MSDPVDITTLLNNGVGNGYYSLHYPVLTKWVSFNKTSSRLIYPGCAICRKRLSPDTGGKYVYSSHKLKKNPVPCHLARVLIQDTQSDISVWCTAFHDLTTKLIGMRAVEFEALPDDTAKLQALGNFRGALMTIKIRKTVKFPFMSYVLADAQVLFTQKDMEDSTINDEVQTVITAERQLDKTGTDRGKGDNDSGRTN